MFFRIFTQQSTTNNVWMRRSLLVFLALFVQLQVPIFLYIRTLPKSPLFAGYDVERTLNEDKLLEVQAQSKLLEYSARGIDFRRTDVDKTPTASLLCVAIMSRPRPLVNYVQRAVVSLIEGMPPSEVYNGNIYVWVADSSGGEPPRNDLSAIRNLVDVVAVQQKKGFPTLNRVHIEQYLDAMQVCMNTGAPYILMLEDDAFATSNWLHKVNGVVAQAHNKYAKNDTKWAVIKLYASEYAAPPWEWPRHAATLTLVTVLPAAVVALCYYLCGWWYRSQPQQRMQSQTDNNNNKINNKNKNNNYSKFLLSRSWTQKHKTAMLLLRTLLLFLVVWLYLVTLVMCIGRHHLFHHFAQGLSSRYVACCTVADLWKREIVESYLPWAHRNANDTVVDLLPGEFFHNVTRQAELVYVPSLFEHIGRFTSLDCVDTMRKVNPWYSMNFKA